MRVWVATAATQIGNRQREIPMNTSDVPKIAPRNAYAKHLMRVLEEMGENGRARLGRFGVSQEHCIGFMLGNLGLPQATRKLYELGQRLGYDCGRIEFSCHGCATIIVFIDAHAQAWHGWDSEGPFAASAA